MAHDILRILDLSERLGNLAESRLKAAVAAQGLQAVHARILLYLARANRYSNTPQAVADYLGLTKGTVSQSLILLENKGFLARLADAHDGRVVRLVLTEAGRSLVGAVEAACVARLAEAGRDLPEGLLDALTEVLRRLQLAEGRRSFGQCRTCRHHLEEAPERWRCGLTGEALTAEEGERICREHEAARRS
jgi:DNA-binding MarR family transcriptional regulator